MKPQTQAPSPTRPNDSPAGSGKPPVNLGRLDASGPPPKFDKGTPVAVTFDPLKPAPRK